MIEAILFFKRLDARALYGEGVTKIELGTRNHRAALINTSIDRGVLKGAARIFNCFNSFWRPAVNR